MGSGKRKELYIKEDVVPYYDAVTKLTDDDTVNGHLNHAIVEYAEKYASKYIKKTSSKRKDK